MSDDEAPDPAAIEAAQLAMLLAPPSEADEIAHYASVLAPGAPGHGDVTVKRVKHGKGLVAARAFREGERVLVEPPLVGMQHERNRADAIVCGGCFRFVGSIEHQIARRLLESTSGGGGGGEENVELNASALATARGMTRDGLKLPGSDAFPLPEIQACLTGCSREVYCGFECALTSMQSHEMFLCVGGHCADDGEIAEDRPDARAFVEHARETNDIFILAAKALVKVAADAGKLEGLTGDGESDALAAAWAPFRVAHKPVWWDAVARPEDVAVGDEETAFRESMREIATESLRLLRASSTFLRFVKAYPGLFHIDVYSRIIGMFETNNLEIAVASPVEDYFLAMDELPPEGPERAITDPLLDALDTKYCVPCEGTGFFALQSCMNNDCDPNVTPLKDDGDIDGKCVLVAKRAIAAGEELTMCYVDEGMDVRARRAELLDYGFECGCARCEREAAGLGQARRGSKMK